MTVSLSSKGIVLWPSPWNAVLGFFHVLCLDSIAFYIYHPSRPLFWNSGNRCWFNQLCLYWNTYYDNVGKWEHLHLSPVLLKMKIIRVGPITQSWPGIGKAYMLPLNDELASECQKANEVKQLPHLLLTVHFMCTVSDAQQPSTCWVLLLVIHWWSCLLRKNSLEVEKSVLSRFCCQLNEINFLMQFKLSAIAKNLFCHCGKELSSGCGVSQWIMAIFCLQDIEKFEEQLHLAGNWMLKTQLLGESNLNDCSMKLTAALN